MLPEVFAIAAMDAAHGAYSRQNTRKENAERGVKICASIIGRLMPVLPPTDTPSAIIVSVLTTASLADRPVIRAAAACQSPNPRGVILVQPAFPPQLKGSHPGWRQAQVLCRSFQETR